MSIEADISVVRAPRLVKPLPPRKFLQRCFDYDPLTGVLKWKKRPRAHFKSVMAMRAWNTRYAGSVAGTHNTSGALGVGVSPYGVLLSHRMIVVLMGVPLDITQEVDHKNRKRDDNRWENLRVCTDQQNAWNAKQVRHVNHELPRGVSPNGNNFKAMITHDGKLRYLGTFKTPSDARAAYLVAERKLRGEFALSSSPDGSVSAPIGTELSP
jgi:hypothetical protein